MSLVTRTPMALEIDRRDFTHSVNDDAVCLRPEAAPARMTPLIRADRLADELGFTASQSRQSGALSLRPPQMKQS